VSQKLIQNKYFTTDTILIGIIIITGTILRFYNYSDLPYSYDEFSALFRTRFTNFFDLIEYGVVKTDTHPAGVQVFMFLWVKLFGEGAMIVKLPFVVSGILTIYFTYRLGKVWFNSSVGLIAAMFISFLQYPITYSQYARPYTSGVFLAVLFVWFFHRAFIERTQKHKSYIVGYILTGAALAYNHHFSLFFIGLAGTLGIFLLKKEKLLTYILSGIMIFVLYIPHLRIFFIQLGKGGVESWLKKPDPSFFMDYAKYILHYHYLMYVAAVILFLLSFYFVLKTIRSSNKYRLILLCWILVTWITAYYYSVYHSAVLQYSVLIFTYPFLVLLVFSFMGDLKAYSKYVIVIVFGSLSIYTLSTERNHYSMQYRSVFNEVMEEISIAKEAYGNQNVTGVTNFRKEIVDFYADNYSLDSDALIRFDTLTTYIDFREELHQSNSEYLAIGFVNIPNLEIFAIAREVFPYLVKKETYYTGDFYLLSKNSQDSLSSPGSDDLALVVEKGQEEMYEYMTKNDYAMLWENDRLRMPGWLGFTLFYDSKLSSIVPENYNYLLIRLDVESAKPDFESQLICEILQGDSILYKTDMDFSKYINTSQGIYSIHQGIKLIDQEFQYTDETIRIYLWNKDEAYFFINNFRIELTEGNKGIYGLFQKIPH